MPYFETSSGVKIHYEVTGNGPPLVFIHGWGMSGRVWRLQIGLADSCRVVIPDLRGHGLSAAPDSGYSFNEFAHDLEELFSCLELDKAIIIAWSMGVLTALHAFPLIRERLAALVFVSGTSRFTVADDYPYGLPSFEARGLALRLKKDYEKAVRDFISGMFTETELLQGCYGRMFSEKIYGEFPRRHAAQESLKSLASADLRPVLPSVELPVLLIHGSNDVICPPTASRFMAAHLSLARLEIVEGAGHAPFLSRPTEFMTLLRKFIDEIHAHD